MNRFIFPASAAMLLVLGVSIPAAHSDTESFKEPSPIVGSWSFETAPYREATCVMSGNMNIQATPTPDVFNCSFTAIEACEAREKWVVEQTCKAVSVEGKVLVESSIVNFLEARDYTASYAPDHFQLQVQSRELMTGSLISAVTAPVEFRRNADNLS